MAIYTDLNSIDPTRKALLEDVESVYQGLINLFNTRPGERVFNPEFGFPLEDDLFELIDDLTALQIYQDVITVVQRWESRAIIDGSRTTITPDPDNNRYDLELIFELQGVTGRVFSFVGSFTK